MPLPDSSRSAQPVDRLPLPQTPRLNACSKSPCISARQYAGIWYLLVGHYSGMSHHMPAPEHTRLAANNSDGIGMSNTVIVLEKQVHSP